MRTQFLLATAALVTSGAPQRQSVPSCNTSLAATPTLPATLPLEIHSNHSIIPVCYGGKPLTFVMDTGAGTTMFDLESAQALGVAIGPSFAVGGGGAGTTRGAQIRRDSITIPGASIVVPVLAALDLASIERPEGGTVNGILGADFLSRFVVEIDYRNLQVHLYDPATFAYKGTGSTIPFRIERAFIHINVQVGLADGAQIPADCVVDVGSGLALALTKPFVDQNQLRTRTGKTIHRPSGRGAGGVAVADIGRVENVRIGDITLLRPVAYLFGDSAGVFSGSTLGDGNIGGDILRRFAVYFDYGRRQMILEPNAGTDEPFETDMSGVQWIGRGEDPGILVGFVLADSPAAQGGLMKDDVVMSVNGNAVKGSSLDDLRKRLRHEGDAFTLGIRRNGAAVTVHFTTKRLV